MLPNWDGRSCGLQRLACTSLSFFVVAVMLLFRLTTRVDLLPTQGVQSLSMISSLSVAIVWRTAVVITVYLSLDTSESSESMSTSAGSYSFSLSSFIPSTSFAALRTRALLICASRRCQSRTRLFWLTRCVGRPRPVMAIANCLGPGFAEFTLGITIFDCGLIIDIAFPGLSQAWKRFCSVLASAMTFPFLINVIVVGLSWYVIPLLRSWPSEIKLESHPGAKATLYNSIMLPPVNRMETVPISSVRITCPAAVTKSMLLAFVFENSFQSLHRWREAHESRNQMSVSIFCNSLAMQAFPTGSGANSSTLSESSGSFVTWCARWGARDPLLLSVRPLVLEPPIRATLLSGWRQSRPKWPSLWQL